MSINRKYVIDNLSPPSDILSPPSDMGVTPLVTPVSPPSDIAMSPKPSYNHKKNHQLTDSAVFSLYENEIGQLSKVISDNIAAAIDEFGPVQVQQAITVAVTNNVRKWSYVDGVLKRQRANGADGGPASNDWDMYRAWVTGETSFADLPDTIKAKARAMGGETAKRKPLDKLRNEFGRVTV